MAVVAIGLVVALASVSLGQVGSSKGENGQPAAATPAETTQASAEAEALKPVGDGEIGVGIFNPEAIWQAWEGRSTAEVEHQQLQMEMQQAQQSGDQAAMMQAAQKMERAQQELMQSFMSAIEEAAPAIAEEAGLDVVAGEIFYGADAVAEREISQQLVVKMNAAVAEQAEETETDDE